LCFCLGEDCNGGFVASWVSLKLECCGN
jgi:hypothetical protein